jgi:hypothetical protein
MMPTRSSREQARVHPFACIAGGMVGAEDHFFIWCD